jgi:cobaltochelatase CobT subunit
MPMREMFLKIWNRLFGDGTRELTPLEPEPSSVREGGGRVLPYRRPHNQIAANSPYPYAVYTREFDREVISEDLDTVLGPQSVGDRSVIEHMWSQALVCRIESDRLPDCDDAVVAFLIDQSGSMKGDKIQATAGAVHAMRALLQSRGYGVEVFGFTTSSWKGGRSRNKWKRDGLPPYPGRLCDVLYVSYGDDLMPMLRPDLLKENLDGEALEWAAQKLREWEKNRKILIVISDGAPVDDSTLMENGSHFLWNHLLAVRDQILGAGDISLAGLGIGHDVSSFYSVCESAPLPNDVAPALLRLVEKVLAV